jgi:uncharacterized protein
MASLTTIIELVKKEFGIDWDGLHGGAHMARVLENGQRIADLAGANKEVVSLFAYFHDAKRLNNAVDPGHGKRGAEFAKTHRGSLVSLKDSDFELLVDACERHTDGLTDADVTVQACWDADRLDLGRIGVRPNPEFLCTDAAKRQEIIDWAYLRSRN